MITWGLEFLRYENSRDSREKYYIEYFHEKSFFLHGTCQVIQLAINNKWRICENRVLKLIRTDCGIKISVRTFHYFMNVENGIFNYVYI